MWRPSTSTVSTPPVAVATAAIELAVSVPAEPAARLGIWKQETENAVAGLLTEIFYAFKEEKLEDEPDEVPVESSGRPSLI